MKKKRGYYFGFYRDYFLKDRPVICQVVDNVDFFSCELLGGDYPLLEESLSREEMKKFAVEIATSHNASFIEINNDNRKRIPQANTNSGVPDTKNKP